MTVSKVKDFTFKSGPMTKNFAKGGKVMPQGMIKNRGNLGVMANKNPGETSMNTAPNLPSEKMMMNKGGMAKGGMHMMPGNKMMPDSKMMNKGGMAAFEKSGKDIEKKGMREGSKADMAMDKKQMMKKGGMAKSNKNC